MSRMNSRHLVSLAVAAALAAAAMNAQAQSTATQIEEGELVLDEVTVTAQKVAISGLLQKEDATKSKTTVTAEYLETQASGQTVLQSLNLVPGVNFTNNDPYGVSGGNLRMRSFDGNRISLMVDGIQLNDSGNYAIYSNQQLDPEILERASVNLGTTDVDSPTASATGGTINLVTARPKKTPAAMVSASLGSFDFNRVFARLDSGEFGPWGTSSFVSVSHLKYDKFKGPGNLERTQVNARLFQPLAGAGDFVALSIHGNRNRNDFYNNPTYRDLATVGWDFDQNPTWTRPTPVNGTVQNESLAANSGTSFYGARINPSDTANIRAQLSLGLTDRVRFTFDPSYQYVLANGGGYTAVAENNGRLRGQFQAAGVDLNGDGDFLDTIGLYSPSNTNTNRIAVNSGLLFTLTDTDLIRFSYTFDRAWHRQTGQYGFFDAEGFPGSPFAGLKATQVLPADYATNGFELRKRDRRSIALLNQFSISYSGRYMEDRLRVNAGLRAPFFERNLNQYCYTPVANPGGDPYCTTQVASAPAAGTGYVTFPGSTATYVRPYAGTLKYDKLLPNVGASITPWGDENSFYATYAKGFSAPRTDNLYSRNIVLVQPETTNTYELGYRYQGNTVLGSIALWKTDFSNRIVSSFDEEQGISIDRNVGDVELQGFDLALGFEPLPGLTVYGTASYVDSEIQDDVRISATQVAATGGKKVVETPDVTYGARVEYVLGGLKAGVQAKYVGRRWSTDVNDQAAPSYKTVDLDARYAFNVAGLASQVQFNVLNVFDEKYLAGISTAINDAPGTFVRYTIGAPRTYQVSLQVAFGGN
jgi:iron complex outermembrane receptor protein